MLCKEIVPKAVRLFKTEQALAHTVHTALPVAPHFIVEALWHFNI